jgi:hypothetical protein
MKTYMTDRRKPRDNGTWYTPYQQDADDLARRRAQEPWIVTKILVAILIPMMVIAAFITSPIMGFAMVGTMLFVAFKP